MERIDLLAKCKCIVFYHFEYIKKFDFRGQRVTVVDEWITIGAVPAVNYNKNNAVSRYDMELHDTTEHDMTRYNMA